MARAEDGFFDDLARGLADGSITRGKAIRLMGAAVVGGTLGSFGLGGVALADEECKPTGKKCRKDKQCCSGKCSGGICAAACGSNGDTCATGTECCSGTCKGGVCAQSCIPPDAISCNPYDPDNSCPGGIGGGCTCIYTTEGEGYCATNSSDIPCSTSCDCPAGQVCHFNIYASHCVFASTVCPVG
jgi:hypothetical protein